MIIVRYIENILNKGNRKSKEFEYKRGKTLLYYLGLSGFPEKNHRFIVSGKPTKDIHHFIKNGDEIIVTPEVEGPFSWFVAKFMADWAAIWATAALVLDIAIFAYSIVSSILAAQRKPSFSFGEGIDEGSNVYGWDGIRTAQDVGIPVPVVYGEHRVGGNIINAWIRNDGRKSYLNVLLALCEGEIEDISSVQINENSSDNYDDITLTKRYGTNDQSVISNFEDAHNLYAVDVDLNTQDATHTYTTSDSDVEAFEVYLQFPSGLFQGDNGIKEWSVTYKVEYRINGSGDPWTEAGEVTVTDKSRSRLREVFRQTGLTAEQYDIKVTRTSEASSLDPLKEGDLKWSQVDEIKTDDFKYPNTALLSIEALATEQISGAMPNLTCLVKGKKISAPQVMNGESQVDWEDYYWDDEAEEFKLLSDDTSLTWDGSTYVDQYCANPIWCLKDLLTNSQYGLGEFIDSDVISDSDFLEMAKHCEETVPDGAGGYEKRFRLDVVLDSSTKALDLLLQLAMTFRGLVSFSSGSIRALIDKDETPVQLFNMGNIIADSFVQSWKSVKEVPNVIEVQYLDKDQDYKQDTVAYIDEDSLDDGDPMRKKNIRLFATKKSYILREARYAMKYAKYLNRSVSFKAGIDAIACQAGDVISVQHDVPQWGYGGRVVSATNDTITLDQEVTIEDGKNYKILVYLSDDTSEEKEVTTSPATTDTLTISGTWDTNPSAYDKYSFGESGSVKKDFRILSMEREGQNEVKIMALEHNTNVYDDSDIDLPDNNYSSLTLTIPAVTNLSLTERLIKLKDGTIENAIDVWWDKPDRDNFVRTLEKCRVYVSQTDSSDKDDYRVAGETQGKSFSIIGDILDAETYYVKVVGVAENGKEGKFADAPKSSIGIVGKSANPSDVSSFLVNQNRDRLKMGWTEVDDVDVWGYEIRWGSSWTSAEVVAFVQGDSYITTNFRTGSGQSYWIKALDTSGNYSDSAKEATITIDNIPFRNIIEEYSEQTDWSGSKSDTEKDGDNLIISSGETSGTYTTPVKDLGYVATFYLGIEAVTSISSDRKWNDDGTTKFNTYDNLRFTGMETPGAATFRIKTSEDNVSWTDWKTYQAGDYKCRYYQIEMTLTRENVEDDLNCSQLDHYADLPDVDETQDGEVTVAADGDEITFEKTFHESPALNVTILTGDGVFWKASSLDTTGVTIKLYDESGVLKTGTFRIHIHGT